MPNIELYKGDCLEVMDELVKMGVKVDAIITDPPYSSTRSKWDKIIPAERMWELLKQLRKDKAPIVLFGNEPFSSLLRTSNLKEYRYDWKWVKNHQTGFANANYRPMNKYEDIIVFSNGNASAGGKSFPMTYFPQGLTPINKTKKNTSKRQGLISYSNTNLNKDNLLMQDGKEYVQKFTNYPANVLFFDCESKYVHPTQKPLSLLEYLVKTYTNEGDTVLDFTMGSGTTGVACKNLNRNFIGIELDENYYKIAKERVYGKENEG